MFTDHELLIIKKIIENITYNRIEAIHKNAYQNIKERMLATGCHSLSQYLEYCSTYHNDEQDEFISCVLDGNTSWFRDVRHFNFLHTYLQKKALEQKDYFLAILCVGVSTGEEAYSLGMFIEEFNRQFKSDLKYKIIATDINRKAIQIAKKSIYELNSFIHFQNKYSLYIDKIDDKYFSISNSIRNKIFFEQHNVCDTVAKMPDQSRYDIIFIKNVLSALLTHQISLTANDLIKRLKPSGLLFTSLSEPLHLDTIKEVEKSIYCQKHDNSFASKEEKPEITSNNPQNFKPELIVIGSSTGGPTVLKSVLTDIGKPDCPPIIIAQHIEAFFSKLLAEDIAKKSKLSFKEIYSGLELQPGSFYMGTERKHFGIVKLKDKLIFKTKDKVDCSHWPCIDYLFESIARTDVKHIAILLTGMGKDGARGLKKIKDKGNITIVQDERSSAIFGMPKAAISINAQTMIAPPEQIREYLFSFI